MRSHGFIGENGLYIDWERVVSFRGNSLNVVFKVDRFDFIPGFVKCQIIPERFVDIMGFVV